MIEFVFLFFLLIFVSQFYFFLASKFSIVDKPNDRSSHKLATVRGGGIIFFLGLIFWFIVYGFPYPYFMAGAFLIACISFLDDLKAQSPTVRMVIHISAFSLLGVELSIFLEHSLWIVLLIYLVGIGTLNAFNFMDGINGMTGSYALVSIVSLLAVDQRVGDFTDQSLIITLLISVSVFLLYNFRQRARCFAGDVGSVTLAFILVFLVLQLMVESGDYGWFILFAVYGVDSAATIIYRLANHENIFKAHRSHVYQYLANELGYSHLLISVGYATLQLLINILVFFYLPAPTFVQGVLIVAVLAFPYLLLRESLMARLGRRGVLTRLFNTKSE